MALVGDTLKKMESSFDPTSFKLFLSEIMDWSATQGRDHEPVLSRIRLSV